MTGVKRLIIADAHVGQGEDDATAMMSVVDRAIGMGVGELIYLGDAFQYLDSETNLTQRLYRVRRQRRSRP